MKPHAHLMSKHLGKQVSYVDDIFGTYAKIQIASMENGDVILLENVRFYSEESLERTPPRTSPQPTWLRSWYPLWIFS